MAGPWEKYQQQPAIDQPQPEQAGPWAKYQTAEPVESANDAAAEQSGIEAMDYGKEIAGGALVGTGSVVSGFGDLLTTAGNAVERGARAVLPAGAVDALKSIPAPSDLLFRPAGRQIDAAGKQIQATKTEAAKQALEASTPQGDVLDPSSWRMGDDPSLAGYGLHGANLVGQFVPQAAALAIPGSQARMAGMAGIGGLQAGGAAGEEVEQRLAATPDAELQQASDLYRQMRANGLDEATARAQVSATARAAAFQGAAPVGAVGGAMTHYALGPLQRQIGGSAGRRLAGGLALDAPAEGAQEVGESVAARAATNQAIGEQRSLTEDTFGDALLGAMGGAGHASLGAVLGRPEHAVRPADSAAEPDATFEDAPEPGALPAPGLQGLPKPEPTFYADSQGNMQDVGPVRNVDGEMQPDPQGRQWVNPRNRADRPVGGEGMERQVPRGEPAPLEGQFQHGSRQRVAETGSQKGQTLEGKTQQTALPAPEAIVVDGQGNAQRGATAPQVFERPLAGGRGMDQQAPTAIRRDDGFEFISRTNGEPFQAHGAAKASKAFREAKKAGRNPTVAKVDGGFAVRVPADPKRYQMRPIDQAAHEAATSPTNDLPAPTPAQIEAGNYKKGRVRVQGLDISIENPRGSERSGTGPDGTPWRRTMSDHYGYIKRTTGADGEQVDVYVGPQQDSDQVFVVDQLNQQDGSFDEHKAMLGYPDQAMAVQAYSANFDEGWQVGPVTAMPVAEFKSWLKVGALSKPLALPSPIAQPAAAAAATKEPQEKPKPKGARRAVDRDRDSVVQAAIRLGGITNQWKQDTTGDTKGNKNIPGVGALWSDNTGTSLDDMASLLDQHGYVPAGEMDRDGGVSWLQDALRDELAGRKTHYAPDSARQLEQYELEMLERINEQLAAERDQLETEYARIEAKYGAEAAAHARSQDAAFDEDALRYEEFISDEPERTETFIDGNPLDEDAAVRRDDEVRAADATEAGSAGQDRGASFSLEQQTEAGLKEQAERNAAAEKARADQERETEQKAQADRDRGDFTLTGSDRISDVAAARGQNDMFGAQPTTSASKAKQQATQLAKKKPSPAEPATEPKPAKVEDFGEKLGGARKDELRGLRERLDNMDDQSIANSKLSALWPKGEIDRIEDTFHAAAYQTVRDFIPTKPRAPYRIAGWVNKVKAARELLAELSRMGGDSTVAKMRAFSPSLRSVADKIELLMGIDRSQWARIGRVSMATGSYSKDGQMVPGSWAEVEIDGRGKHFYGKGSIAEAMNDVRLALNLKSAPEKKMQFDVYSDRATGQVFIAKSGDRETRRLATFKSVAEAREHIANEHGSLVAAWDAVKNRDNVTKADMRRSLNEVRTGTDHRGGADITPEQFLEAFGFRGVEFGNWVAQGDGSKGRQGMLNDAYDAFMDLAEVVGVPPKALSLEGRLGIGFGSRGRGRASAHFEPDTVVINLTKTKGAGSLAHEWFHALDNYFAGKREASEAKTAREASYITYRPEPVLVNKKYPAQSLTRAKLDMYQANHPNAPMYAEANWMPDPAHPEGVRPKVEKAFAEVVATLDQSPMAKRSAVLDKGAADGYWSRIIERGARSFETYVIAKLADRGYRNDYLANVRSLEEFSRSQDRYPYLTPDEQGPVNEAFDKLFSTIEARETDAGVSLYRLGEGSGTRAEHVTDALSGVSELAGVKVVQTFDDLPLSARIRAKRDGIAPDELRGIYSSGATYVVAGNHASIADAVFTAVHEEVGHRGIHGLLGDQLDATMERLYASQAATAKGRQRIAQIRQAYAKVLKKLDARKQRLMIAEEMVAHLIEDGERPMALQRMLSKARELLRALFPQVPWTYTDILALGEQSRQWLRDRQAGVMEGDSTRYALAGKRQHTSEAFSDLTAKQKEALNKIAPRTAKQQAIDWFRQHSDRALLKIRQGIVDRYAALRELDVAVHGNDVLGTDITSSAWVLARMSSAASGALHAMLNNGRIYLDQQQKVIDIQDGDALGLGATLARLGSAAEIERFMGWIAGNRSAKLAVEGRENLFDAAEIDALRTLDSGTTEHGKARGTLYTEVFAEFQQYRDDVLAIAEQTGVITTESRALWRDEFYVPFYRVMDEDAAATGPMASKGLTRQEAYKKLKGGSQNLNDLLQNTLLNFNHLLQASLRNQAAGQAIDNAEQLGIAQPVSEASRDKKASTFVLKAGVKQWYNIGDPLVFEALSSLSDASLNNAAVRAMSFFKRLFTNMTTITPQFIIANLLRDSMSATATSPVSKNFLKNIAVGGANWTDTRKRARMLASGGAFSFGHIYSNDPDEVKAHITRNLRSAKLIDGPKLVPQALKAGWDAWNAVANTAENANRAAIFEQNEQGSGKLAAAFEARDLMDFSMHGAWPAVRFLIRVVPFLNARLQGLDKLYRAGVKPSLLTAFGQGNASDKQAAARFMTVVGALSMASMALMLVNNDDEEYRKLEEWQKDTYWFVRVGSKAFFIPKPFEVGAIATMAERLLQQAIDDKATGKLFAQRLGHTLTQTFSFSPVPHMFQPVLDVYSNVDAFTGRPIESTGMDRLSKGLRTRATTTAPARAASAVSRVFGDEFPLAVSPIQADHLIAGYLGQVGAWGAGMVDTMWRAANGESQPARHWHEYQPIRRFYRDLDTPAAYTRYSTIFYEGLREAGKAYADVKELQELGRMDEAREVIREKRDVLGLRKQLNQVQRRLSAINGRMDAVRLGELDADAKRRELDRLVVIKSRLTEMAGKRVEDIRAKR